MQRSAMLAEAPDRIGNVGYAQCGRKDLSNRVMSLRLGRSHHLVPHAHDVLHA